MERKENNHYYGIGILIILFVGMLVGLSMESARDLFYDLFPVTFIISGVVMGVFQKAWNFRFLFFLGFVYVVGFSADVMGVESGSFFGGTYTYGNLLGLKVAGVPIIMGFLWVLWIYSIGELNRFLLPKKESRWIRVLLGAFFMVILDLLMEPLAPGIGLWTWKEGEVPVMNYLTWFGLSVLFLALYTQLRCKRRNRVAAAFYPIQVGFFILLLLIV